MSDLVPTTPTALDERVKFAQLLARASLLPTAYRDKPANVLLAMEYADALGLSPIAAIQGIHVVDGKPTASAQLIGALIRRAGHRMRVTVAPDGQSARAEIVRSDDPDFVFVSEWTMARAEAAGLTGKGTWKQYAANMLKARAITEVGRDACPEVLAGVPYTPEELGDDVITGDHRHAGTATGDTPAADALDLLEATGIITVDDEPVDVTDAVIVDETPAPVDTGKLRGPAARDAASQLATVAQVTFLERFATSIGFDDLGDYLNSPPVRGILGGTPSSPLLRGHASTLIDAAKAFQSEAVTR